VQTDDVDVVGLKPTRRAEGEHLHRRAVPQVGLLLLAQPEVGDGGDRAGELARRGLRRARDVGGGQLAEVGQGAQALDHV
jgi:hypothetical protein